MTKQEVILANQQYLFPSVFHYFKRAARGDACEDQFVWMPTEQVSGFLRRHVTISAATQ